MELLLLTITLCTLGALANVVAWAKTPKEIVSFEGVKSILLGLLVGIPWYFMRVEHGVPDSVVSFVVGYCAKDVIEALAERFKPFKRAEKIVESGGT